MIKGALFDIDDTLYSHLIHAVPKQTIILLDRLREKGIKTGICTSRTVKEFNDLPQELISRIDCVISASGAVTEARGLYSKTYSIEREYLEKYLDYFHNNNIDYCYCTDEGRLFYYGEMASPDKVGWLALADKEVCERKCLPQDKIINLFYVNVTQQQQKDIESINTNTKISVWENNGNICPSYVDKGFGLMKFCQVYGFITDEIVAAGDGVNDDVMLEMAGIGIAVNNATENTKAAADYICTKSIEDGGLYDAFIELKIIEESIHDIRMFCFDCDSTVYDHKKGGISEKTIEGMKKLRNNGYKLCLNTSRSYEELNNIPEQFLDLMDVLILINGSYIVKDGKVRVRYIPEEDMHKAVRFMDEHQITYRYCTDDGHGYISQPDKEKMDLFFRLYAMCPAIKKYEGEKVVQFLFYKEGDLQQQLLSLIPDEGKSFLGFVTEVLPPATNKGTAMLDMAKEYGFDSSQICAFGDTGNDIEMLQLAGLGIAMGNGSRECKDHADYITDDISDEGLYKALVHFGFIED